MFHQIVNKNILMSVSPPAGGAAFLPTTKVGGISPRSGDDGDDTDDADDSGDDSTTSNGINRHERATSQEKRWSTTLQEGVAEMEQEGVDGVNTVITVINRHQRHQSDTPTQIDGMQNEYPGETNKKHCPHHPQERWVRFDPAGQAWCDKLDCWDCYRLMKIGEALGYRGLTDQRDHRIIDQGMPTWSAYILSQRPFMVVLATQLAIEMCTALGIEVPDLSGEVRHLVEACLTDT